MQDGQRVKGLERPKGAGSMVECSVFLSFLRRNGGRSNCLGSRRGRIGVRFTFPTINTDKYIGSSYHGALRGSSQLLSYRLENVVAEIGEHGKNGR